ncbi:hypothetical protein GCM10025865_25180 [Paraoerskovia sediminicola]|uniref:DUF7937 domain-containing protein n=1 Tax=Paraoerskovia sediminicola TaxID=1138587 RepID=A0ABN6XEG9_9CELL|nr:hypothetical protein [Paraoerskovia sediminicola]BDZ43219.1 hypothetical protein GCM10025865_25180 [Paraoerskovia sediminicola]
MNEQQTHETVEPEKQPAEQRSSGLEGAHASATTGGNPSSTANADGTPVAGARAGGTQGAGTSPGASVSGSSPFAGVPFVDYARDVVAALLVLMSLSLPWDATTRSVDRVDVVLVSLVTLLSLSLPYLARGGLMPDGWTVHRTRNARLLANLPYAVLVLVYLLKDLLAGLDGPGLGTAVGLGLAAALLAAQPRRCEIGDDDAEAGPRRAWTGALAGLGAAAVVATLAALTLVLVLGDDLGVALVLRALLATVFLVVLVGWPVLGAVRGDTAWSTVLLGLGVIVAVTFVLGSGSAVLLHVTSPRVLGFALLLVPAAAAVSSSALLRGSSVETAQRARSGVHATANGLGQARDEDAKGRDAAATNSADSPAESPSESSAESPAASSEVTPDLIPAAVARWVGVARRTLLLLAVTAGYVAATGLFEMLPGGPGTSARSVLSLVLGLLVLSAALLAAGSLDTGPVAGRPVALTASGAAAVVGIVLLLVTGDLAGPVGGTAFWLLALGLPALVIGSLTIPAELRRYVAEHRPEGALPPPPTCGLPASRSPSGSRARSGRRARTVRPTATTPTTPRATTSVAARSVVTVTPPDPRGAAGCAARWRARRQTATALLRTTAPAAASTTPRATKSVVRSTRAPRRRPTPARRRPWHLRRQPQPPHPPGRGRTTRPAARHSRHGWPVVNRGARGTSR